MEIEPLLQSSSHLSINTDSINNNDNDNNNNNKSLSPHDISLTSLRLFWYTVWLCFVEVIFLSFTITARFAVTYYDKHDEDKDGYGYGYGSSEEQPAPNLPLWDLLINVTPGFGVLVACVALFVMRRTNVIVRKVLLVTVCVAFLMGIAGFCLAFYSYLWQFFTKNTNNCEEYEGWSIATRDTLSMMCTICPTIFRFFYARLLWGDIKQPLQDHTVMMMSQEPKNHMPPIGYKIGLIFLLLVVSLGGKVRGTVKIPKPKNRHGQLILQHSTQLVYECILLLLAVLELKYIELIAIGAGLLGSVFGLLRLFMLDIILNFFATVMALFLLLNTLVHIMCWPNWQSRCFTLILFVIAIIMRLESFSHAYAVARMQIHQWLQHEHDCVVVEMTSSSTSGITSHARTLSAKSNIEFNNDLFAKVPMQTLVLYPVAHGHDAHAAAAQGGTKAGTAAAATGGNVHAAATTGGNAHMVAASTTTEDGDDATLKQLPKKRNMCGLFWAWLVAMILVVSLSVYMIIQLPGYANAPHAVEFKSYTKSDCAIRGVFVPSTDVGKFRLFEVYLNNFTKIEWMAIPIWKYFSEDTPPKYSDIYETWKSRIKDGKSYSCRQGKTRIDASVRGWVKRGGEYWDSLIVLTTDDELSDYVKNFYFLVLVPPCGIAIGIGVVVIVLVFCARDLKRHKGHNNTVDNTGNNSGH